MPRVLLAILPQAASHTLRAAGQPELFQAAVLQTSLMAGDGPDFGAYCGTWRGKGRGGCGLGRGYIGQLQAWHLIQGNQQLALILKRAS